MSLSETTADSAHSGVVPWLIARWAMGNGFLVVRRTGRVTRRGLRPACGWIAVLGGAAVAACSSSSAVTGPIDFDSGFPTVGAGGGGAGGGGGGGAGGASTDGGEPNDAPVDVVVPPGGSVGSACSASMPCRMGLSCSGMNVCV